MTQYLELRREACELLGRLDGIRTVYADLSSREPDEVASYVRDIHFDLKTDIDRIQMDSRLNTLVVGEPNLRDSYEKAVRLWQDLVKANLIEPDGEIREVSTKLPPVPPASITGETVLQFLQEMCDWLLYAAEELWQDEEVDLKLPRLGDRFSLGEFSQTRDIVNAMSTAESIRQHWLSLSSTGDFWDTVNVGSSRARLIYVSVDIVNTIVNPPEEPPQLFKL